MVNESLSQEIRIEVASAFASLLQSHSAQLSAHCRRVAQWARTLGEALGEKYALGADAVDDIEIAGFLHDIGLVTVPLAALSKGGSRVETSPEMQQHVLSGYAALASIQSFERIAVGILHHHETFDGHGFPGHLWRRAIPLFARILAVVDTYDHALHFGFSLDPQDQEHAIRVVEERSGRGLDPSIVRVFMRFVRGGLAGGGAPRRREIEMPPQALEPGMVLARDLRSVGNVVLLRAGTELTRHVIEQIMHQDVAGNAVTTVFVERDSLPRRPPRPTPPPPTPRATLQVRPRGAEEGVGWKRPQIIVLSNTATTAPRVRAELEPMGMQVRETADEREEAGDALAEGAEVTVVLDLSLGIDRARGTVENLAQNAATPYCVLLADQQSLPDARELARMETVAGVVSEPWPREALLEAVRKAIDLNHHHRKA